MATKTKTAPLTEFSRLKAGDALCETQFYKVVKTKGNEVQLTPESGDGDDIVVSREYVEAYLISGNQYTTSQFITKTEAAALLLRSAGVCLTVNYNTKVDAKAVVAEIQKVLSTSSIAKAEAAITAAVKKGLEGEERTMMGRHFGELNDLGRLNFIDMNERNDPSKTYDTRIRQVDPRTINWLIVKGVKYTVK